MNDENAKHYIQMPEVLIDDGPRPLSFRCFRVYDMRRFTATSDQSFIVGYHLQKQGDTHTLCGYKTDTWNIRGRWTQTSLSPYADSPTERDTMCFRCLRVWALKNQIKYPRQWMIDRIDDEEREARKVTMRKDVEQ